jgi:hypothetical protein
MQKKLEMAGCRLHDPIPQKEILQKQKETDVLLFLEDIDGRDANMARLSFSAKIIDYLSSGKCIFAVGCENTAPMQYFLEHDAAVTAFSKEEIGEKLSLLSNDNDMIIRYAENAAKTGVVNHDKIKTHEFIDSTIKALLD